MSGSPEMYRKYKRAFTPGSIRQRFDQQLHVEKEYGEHTWSPDQTMRDILQNHFDAEAERCVMRLTRQILTEDALINIHRIKPQEQEKIKALVYLLYQHQAYIKTAKASEAFVSRVQDIVWSISAPPLQHELYDVKKLLSTITEIYEELPRIEYAVIDTLDPALRVRTVTREQLQSDPYTEERSKTSLKWGTKFRYVVIGCSVQDSGSGFDPQLAALFAPTKQGKPYLRGQYGEGLKMSYLDLLRRKAAIRLRSSYTVIDKGQVTQHVWKGRPQLSEKGDIFFSGADLSFDPEKDDVHTGSRTVIDLSRMDSAAYKECVASIDCRTERFKKSFLDFSSQHNAYQYVVNGEYAPIGVNVHSVNEKGSQVYIQRLLLTQSSDVAIKKDGSEYPLYFSYDIANRGLIGGRDRKTLKDDAASNITYMWRHIEDPDSVRALVRHYFFSTDTNTFEKAILHECIARDASPKTQTLFLDAVITELNIQAPKTLIATERTYPLQENVVERARSRGIPIVVVKNINRYFKNISDAIWNLRGVRLFTWSELQNDPEFIDPKSIEQEIAERHEKRYVEPYNETLRYFERVARDCGIAFDASRIGRLVITKGSEYDSKPYVLEYDKVNNRFYIVVRTHSGHYDKQNFRNTVIALLLATVDRNRPFINDAEVLQVAQANAQYAIDSAMANERLSEVEGTPKAFPDFAVRDFDVSSINPMRARLEAVPQQLRDWGIVQRLSELSLSFKDAEEIARAFTTMREPYRRAATISLFTRCIIQGTEVGYFVFDDDRSRVQFTKKIITDLEVVDDARYPEYKAYIIDDRRSFIITSVPSGSVVTMRNATVYREKDSLYIQRAGRDYIEKYRYNDHFFHLNYFINDGAILYDSRGGRPKISSIRRELSIQLPSVEAMPVLERSEGTIFTSLTTEYGAGVWDDPVRLLEDIVQNHLDASPGRHVEIVYEVQRGKKRKWVQEVELSVEDQIYGIRFIDDGKGYSPSRLSKLGDGTKARNPFLAGKYGEGTKLLAAAAVRNGIELEFSSLAHFDGKLVRWAAQAGSRLVSLNIDGRSQERQQIVFDYNDRKSVGKHGSETTLRIPEEPLTQEQKAFWRRIVDICHSRYEERGQRGLARYIRDLRTHEDGVIDLGFMKILLNEPGVVYDNGLLVQRGRSLVCGYDLLDITDTRERNHVDARKLDRYIQLARQHCPDVRYFNAIMKAIVKNLDRGSPLEYASSELLFDPSGTEMFSLPHVNSAADRYAGGLVFHNTEYFERNHPDIAIIIEHYLRFVPVSIRRDVSYADMRRIFGILPSSYDFAQQFSEAEIPQTARTKQEIAQAIDGVAQAQLDMVHRLFGHRRPDARIMKIFKDRENYQQTHQSTLSRADNLLRTYWNRDEIIAHDGRIFVAPSAVGYHGIIHVNTLAPTMGINEKLLQPQHRARLVGVIHHELAHFVTGKLDHTPEFINYLLLVAQDAHTRAKE